jgi:hypothetical protein
VARRRIERRYCEVGHREARLRQPVAVCIEALHLIEQGARFVEQLGGGLKMTVLI